MRTVKYPDIQVHLIGQGANSHIIITKVKDELKKHNVGDVEVHHFLKEAWRGGYANLLDTCMRWVTVY